MDADLPMCDAANELMNRIGGIANAQPYALTLVRDDEDRRNPNEWQAMSILPRMGRAWSCTPAADRPVPVDRPVHRALRELANPIDKAAMRLRETAHRWATSPIDPEDMHDRKGAARHRAFLQAALDYAEAKTGHGATLRLIAGSDGFNGGTSVEELQQIARAAIVRAKGAAK